MDSIGVIPIISEGGDKMVYVYKKPMPGYCHEMVTANSDGSFTVVINEALSAEQQKQAYEHAMCHICKGHFDFDCPLTVEEMELQAHAQEKGRRTV